MFKNLFIEFDKGFVTKLTSLHIQNAWELAACYNYFLKKKKKNLFIEFKPNWLLLIRN